MIGYLTTRSGPADTHLNSDHLRMFQEGWLWTEQKSKVVQQAKPKPSWTVSWKVINSYFTLKNLKLRTFVVSAWVQFERKQKCAGKEQSDGWIWHPWTGFLKRAEEGLLRPHIRRCTPATPATAHHSESCREAVWLRYSHFSLFESFTALTRT